MDWATLAAAGVLTLVPGALVIYFVRNYIAKGFALGEVWGSRHGPSAGWRGRWRRPCSSGSSAALILAAYHRLGASCRRRCPVALGISAHAHHPGRQAVPRADGQRVGQPRVLARAGRGSPQWIAVVLSIALFMLVIGRWG